MMVPFSTFRRIIKNGENTGAIFESKNYAVTSVGNLTVWTQKSATGKIFQHSYPYRKIGYLSINSSDVKPLTDDEIINSMIEEFNDYPEDALKRIQEAITKILDG